MKILHTPILTKKVGRKALAICKFKTERSKKKPIELEQLGDDATEAIEKVKKFLSSKGQDELVEVESFETIPTA